MIGSPKETGGAGLFPNLLDAFRQRIGTHNIELARQTVMDIDAGNFRNSKEWRVLTETQAIINHMGSPWGFRASVFAHNVGPDHFATVDPGVPQADKGTEYGMVLKQHWLHSPRYKEYLQAFAGSLFLFADANGSWLGESPLLSEDIEEQVMVNIAAIATHLGREARSLV